MTRSNLYLLHYNGRDDNLGDQFIFRALVDALGALGIVHLRGGVPGFIARAPDAAPAAAAASSGHVSLGLRLAAATLGGGDVYTFFPPGGRTWTASGDGSRDGGARNDGRRDDDASSRGSRGARGRVKQFMAAARRRGIDALAGRRIALGASVIPAANHAWCRGCEWIGVRDHQSLTALRAAGLPRVEYFPDLAFLPASPAASSLEDVQAHAHAHAHANAYAHAAAPRIVASFRQSIPEARAADSSKMTSRADAEADGYAARISATLGALLRELPDAARGDARTFYQVDEDAAFARDLGRAHGLSFASERIALDSFDRFYRSADIVISNRLHCLLMGASRGAVPIALTSRAHTKVTALFETVGWQPLILALDDERALPARFAAIQRDLPHWRQMVAETFAEQRALGLALLARRFGARRGEGGAPPAARA